MTKYAILEVKVPLREKGLFSTAEHAQAIVQYVLENQLHFEGELEVDIQLEVVSEVEQQVIQQADAELDALLEEEERIASLRLWQ